VPVAFAAAEARRVAAALAGAAAQAPGETLPAA
jgi:hypothetical protein